MAALEQHDTVRITINDIELDVPKGELIVEAVKRLGLEIPIFCYHPRMKPVGMCRMCLVEVGFKQPDGSVRKMPKPQAGCTLPASDGMVVYTDTEMVHKDRKGVLEFLLINHPLDCPICDRGGECPLQNNTIFYGPSTSRFVEVKRHAHKALPLSQYVTLDLERCIQCGRCVRFTEEISGDAQLAFRFRGSEMQPSTYQLTEFESKFSGNVIEICPVGALTSSKYRFRARPWDLETKAGICTLCSNGCNIWVDYRSGKLVRVNGRTNDSINEDWTCDKGKFGHEFYNSENRLTQPLMRSGDTFETTSWGGAYDAILEAFKPGGKEVAALIGGTVSNEGLYTLKRLFKEGFHSENLDYRWTKAAGGSVSNSIEALEHQPSLLLFGDSLADDLPIIYLRVRKAWSNHGCQVVVASDRPTEADAFAHAVLRYRPGSEDTLASGLKALRNGGGDKAKLCAETGVDPASLDRALEAFSKGGAVVTAQSLLNKPQGAETVESLSGLGLDFNSYAMGANDRGAEVLGLSGGTTAQILQQCAEGKIKALWVVEGDPFLTYHDRGLVLRALENVEFLVYQGILRTETAAFASVILPAEAPAESDGSYTNCEGQVQRMAQILTPPGDTKQHWRIFSECLLRLAPVKPYFNAGEIRAEIEAHYPSLSSTAPKEKTGLPTIATGIAEMN